MSIQICLYWICDM